jgi:UDP-N-acetyl-D-mannosaminuronic acid dehydrogenase
VTALVEKMVVGLGIEMDVCPERIAEGKAMTELFELPQIVSSRTPKGVEGASRLFGLLTSSHVVMAPEEGELAKLFTSAWRYIKFATANQLYMMAYAQGLDFGRIRRGVIADYPRAADMPAPGFAAGRACSRTRICLIMPGQLSYAAYRAARLWVPSAVGAIAAGAFFGLSASLA